MVRDPFESATTIIGQVRARRRIIVGCQGESICQDLVYRLRPPLRGVQAYNMAKRQQKGH